MADHVCPPIVGRLLLSPLRKLVENPGKIFASLVSRGEVVLEPGCAMGFFTLPLARMVGPRGRIIAVDIQPAMLEVLERRARKADLLDRIDIREAVQGGLGIDDLVECVDFCSVIHVAHEVTDRDRFFREISRALKPGARVLLIEPRWHVSAEDFEDSTSAAEASGLRRIEHPRVRGGRKMLFEKGVA
jgi:ubiquinone/menaquinone biosynthesis C-methylase UbiE